MGDLELSVDRHRSALLLVDIQPDFLPGGALPTHEGDVILRPIARLLEADPFSLYVATQILLTSGWFYWFHWRPSVVRSECHREAESAITGRSQSYRDRQYEAAYTQCLHRRGLE